MISKQELKALASLTLTDSYFVSLYLDVDSRAGGPDQWLLRYRGMVKRVQNELSPEIGSRISKDLEMMEKYLREHLSDFKRGLVIISCQERDFWWVYHSMVPFSGELVVDRDPYIKPLMRMIDLFQRYLIVVCENRGVKLFLAGQGQIVSLLQLTPPVSPHIGLEAPGRADRWGKGLKDRQEIALQWLRRGAAGAVERVVESENIKRILLAGSDRPKALLRESLSLWARERVVGEFNLPARATPKEILERATPIMKEVEERFERWAVKELIERIGESDGGSILGLSDVLSMLQQGNVRKLYVLSYYRDQGMVCRNCGALTPLRDRPCPYCGGEMEAVPFIVDWAIQKALEQGARVDMLDNCPELEKAGGIGAILRY